ncbi:MAG: SET domain-containing protein [Saprospiraceae bacterium]|nr:SET domain-containing protein-lysine N-methyltransferase [Saprospiraceae bacterium]MBK8450438.1 SET domain-containing protein-lysine N-methyltransferase [Saprospiraceae bacterium]MBK8485479.1 SET domain-containing protein-lysine N-methyltransferase [Saprospiraceae bacterium]MBK9222706.1 SET domain-containing protein-lysine N-methyltransferase [Saprospiraceae bacterium]MBK9727244.1 SET domain-containing protein-lysine N-methyltransferase [Saprospiraceae bacterium]
MNKSQLLKELQTNTYVRIQTSTIHGIGVFAIQKIPKACRDMFSKVPTEWHPLSRQEVDELPESSRLLVETYCLFDEHVYYVPADGFKTMDVSFFLNHSSEPNIISINDGEFFETLKDIECGEELLIDYGSIVDSED